MDQALRLFRANLVVLPAPVGPVLLLFPGQHVVPDEPAGPRRAGQLVGAGAGLGQQAQPHAAGHGLRGLRLCYIGRSRHGIQVPWL